MRKLLYMLVMLTNTAFSQTSAVLSGTFVENISKEDICYDRAVFPLSISSISYTAPFVYTDTVEFSRIGVLMPQLRTVIIQNGTFQKLPDVLINTGIQTLTVSLSGITDFPNANPGSQIRSLTFSSMKSIPSVLPSSWVNIRYINNLNLQLAGYNTSQVNALITQVEALINAGMGQLITGTHNVYFNGLGTNQNGVPTVATFTGSGWTQTGTGQTSRLTKTILGNLWQIYYNP